MSFDILLKTGFFKTCRYDLDFLAAGIKLSSQKLSNEKNIVVPWSEIYEVSFLRVNDNLVEMEIQSSEASYIGILPSQDQAANMSRMLRDTYKVKIHVE